MNTLEPENADMCAESGAFIISTYRLSAEFGRNIMC